MTAITNINARAREVGLPHRAVMVPGRPEHPAFSRIVSNLGLGRVDIARPRIVVDTTGSREISFPAGARRLKGADAYLVTTCRPGERYVNADLFQAVDLAQALGEAGVANVILFMLTWPYGRQDRKSKPREPITSAAVAQFFESLRQWKRFAAVDGRVVGIASHPIVSRIIVLDPHTSPQGFTTIPVEVISSYALLGQAMRRLLLQRVRQPLLAIRGAESDELGNVAVLSPDEHRVKPAIRFASQLLKDRPDYENWVFGAMKSRGRGGDETDIERYRLPPSLVGRLSDIDAVVIFDDMIATGGTLVRAIEALRGEGFPSEKIWVAAVHALMVGPAKERLEQYKLGGIVVTDSTNIPRDALPRGTRVASLSRLAAGVIRRTFLGESLERVELYV